MAEHGVIVDGETRIERDEFAVANLVHDEAAEDDAEAEAGEARAADGSVLDVWFPAPVLGTLADAPKVDGELAAAAADDADRGTTQEVVRLEIDLDVAPADTCDAWLRLHLLSHRLVAPNSQNLDGIFGLLTNVVWTSAGPCAVDGFEATRARLRGAGQHVTLPRQLRQPALHEVAEGLPQRVDVAALRIGDQCHPASAGDRRSGYPYPGAKTFGFGLRCVNVVDVAEAKGVVEMAPLEKLAKRIKAHGWHVEFLMHADEFPELDRMFGDFPVDIVLGGIAANCTAAGGEAGVDAEDSAVIEFGAETLRIVLAPR